MMTNDSILSPRAPKAVGAFPHARRAGSLLFCSGIGPRRRDEEAIPGVVLDTAGRVTSYDFAIQVHTVFANVRSVVEDAGSSWEQIVDVTAFLTDIEDDFATWNQLWQAYFPTNAPARTTVEVTRLPTPIAIELKVIATLP